MATTRLNPNILIVGTPGTGKSTLASLVAEKANLKHLNVGEITREQNFYESYDEERQCHILDEDKLLDHLEDLTSDGGTIVEYHGCDFFPERWFDVVFVLRTDNTKLFDRLTARGYGENKIRENVECEIFGVLADEATNSYKSEIVHHLQSDTPEQMEENSEQITQWVNLYRSQHMQNGN